MEDELKYSYNVLKFDLTAGMSDVEVPIHAQRIDYVSPTDGPELSIRLQRKSNDALPLRPNGSIEAPFTRLYISAAATPRTVFLMVGAPAGVRVTGRDVAISGSINSIVTKEALDYQNEQGTLYGKSLIVGAAAAAQCGAQLKNQAGSGKTIELYQITVSSDVAGSSGGIGRLDADLASASTAGECLTIGNPVGTTIPRFANSGVVPTSTIIPWFLGAGAPITLRIPALLSPGEGLVVFQSNAAAHNLRVGFVYREF